MIELYYISECKRHLISWFWLWIRFKVYFLWWY